MTEKTLDPSAFMQLQEATGAEFAAELLDAFFSEAPVMLADLKSAFEAQDVDRFRRAAHSLKSNAGTFGATALETQARALELDGLAGAAEALGEIDQSYAQAAQALQDLKDA